MSVAFDAISASPATPASVGGAGALTLTTNAIVVGTINRSVILGGISLNAATILASLTAKLDNSTAMTLVSSGTNVAMGSSAIFALTAAQGLTAGSHTITFTWTTTNSQAYAEALSYTGAIQTGGVITCPNGNSNTGTAATLSTVTVNSAVGDMVYALHQNDSATWGAISGNTRGGPATTLSNNFVSNDASGASPNVAMTAAYTASGNFVAVGVDIAAFVATGDSFGNQMNLIQMKRKSLGWTPPLGDHRRRVLRPNRRFWTPQKLFLPKDFKKVA